ncbi:START-like domain-containing protein [Proteiniphilum sp.]|uniref:START-like domain-containing protein n=1 Tax=Proteiniphilum sp. TaxID=1926877 RepID=UPI002B21053E|nr:START-like domain-containing protein [Proteiniphilum sp.]MEA4917188.1 START-like domain-containing protein [Proteiniphilum sp.]
MSKEKFHIEFLMGNATQSSLWRMISQIDGLSEWFADEVSMDETEAIYTFIWGKTNNEVQIISKKPQSSIRYRWLDEEDEELYFEFLLHKLDLSGAMTLEITDFAEPDEKGDAIALWESQIDEMKRRLGI